jgi:hypothetical protein
MIKTCKIYIGLVISFFFTLNLSAQTLWEKEYGDIWNNYQNRKGDYNGIQSRFISTGNLKLQNANHLAYLVETDLNGNITWQTLIGDSISDWFAESVKTTSGGDYIVVGRTTQDQLGGGVYASDTCLFIQPYYNAFIALISPSNPTSGWYKVFGDEWRDDQAFEVIEDVQGNFVLTGIAYGKYAGDHCEYIDSCVYFTDSIYRDSLMNITTCCSYEICWSNSIPCQIGDTCCVNDTSYYSGYVYSYDSICYKIRINDNTINSSSVLIAKFDVAGNPMFIRRYDNDTICDKGVSLIEDMAAMNYKILVNRNYSNQNSKIRPVIMELDYFGNLTNVKEFAQRTNVDLKAYEVIKHSNNRFVITGSISDTQSIETNSYLLAFDNTLTAQGYASFIHPYIDFVNRDVLIESGNLVITGDAWEYDFTLGKWQTMHVLKVALGPTWNFTLLPLVGTNNISHYNLYAKERNSNFCIYPYLDLFGNNKNGFHLFGNTVVKSKITNVKTDNSGISSCYIMDEIDIENTTILDSTISLDNSELSMFNSFYEIESEIELLTDCDTLDPANKSYKRFANTLTTIDKISEIHSYPNPNSGNLFLEVANGNAKILKVTVFNAIGQEMYSISLGEQPTDRMHLDLSRLSNGLYNVNITLDNGVVKKSKIVITK